MYQSERIVLAVTALLLSATWAGAVTNVTTCGQVLAPGEKGILQTDLDCTGGGRVCTPPSAPLACTNNDDCNCGEPLIVLVGSRGKLDMNGHTVANGDIICDGPGGCKISGGGSLTDAHILGAKNLRLEHLSLHGAGPMLYLAISANGKLTMSDVTVIETTGIAALGKAKFTNVAVTDTLAVSPGVAVYAQGLLGKNVQITGDGGNLLHTYGGRTTLVDSFLAGNPGTLGHLRGPLRLINTTAGVISTSQAPILRAGATCIASRQLDQNGFYLPGNWGVCTMD